MRWLLRVLVVAATGLLLTAAPGAGLLGVAASADDLGPAGEVQALLDQRAAAVRAGNKDGFMSAIDPRATDAFRSAQSLWFDGIRTVPLSEYALKVRLDDTGDLSGGTAVKDRYNAAEVYLPETRQAYQIADFDDRPALDALYFTYVKRDGHWLIAGDNDLESIGVVGARNFWARGPMTVARSAHFIVFSSGASQQRVNEVSGIAEDALAVFQTQWKGSWSGRAPLIVLGSSEEAAEVLGGAVDVSSFSALVSFSPVRDTGWATTAPRIFTQDQYVSKYTRQTQVENLVHELTHVAASNDSGPFTPTWLQEGLAEFVQHRGASVPRPANSGKEFPSNVDFSELNAETLRKTYDKAASVMSFVARTGGLEAPRRLFDAVGERRIVAGSPSFNLDLAVRSATGRSFSDLQSEWANAPN